MVSGKKQNSDFLWTPYLGDLGQFRMRTIVAARPKKWIGYLEQVFRLQKEPENKLLRFIEYVLFLSLFLTLHFY